MTIREIRGCARCGGNHDGPLEARELTRPFAPPEAFGVTWTHWLPCPTNGEPVMIATEEDAAWAAWWGAFCRYYLSGDDASEQLRVAVRGHFDEWKARLDARRGV